MATNTKARKNEWALIKSLGKHFNRAGFRFENERETLLNLATLEPDKAKAIVDEKQLVVRRITEDEATLIAERGKVALTPEELRSAVAALELELSQATAELDRLREENDRLRATLALAQAKGDVPSARTPGGPAAG